MGDDDILVRISPIPLFEILLRKAVGELKSVYYTFERDGALRIPVFDAEQVAALFDGYQLITPYPRHPHRG